MLQDINSMGNMGYIIEDELNKLNIVIEMLKDGINTCDMKIIINSRATDSIMNNIRPNIKSLTEKQKGLYDDLYTESTIQFDRLYKGRCACSPVKNV